MSVFPEPRTPVPRRSVPRTPGSRTPGSRTPGENVIGQIEVSTPAQRSARWTTPLATPLATPGACSIQRPPQTLFSPDLFDIPQNPNFELNSQQIQSPISAASPGFSYGDQVRTPCHLKSVIVPHSLSDDYDYAAGDICTAPRMSDAGNLMMHENDLTIVRRMNDQFPNWYAIIYDLFHNLIVPEDAKICINYLQLLSYMIGYKLLTSSDVPPSYWRLRTLQEDQITPEHQKVFIEAVFTGLYAKINKFVDEYMKDEYNSYIAQIEASVIYRESIGEMGLGFMGDDRGGVLNEELEGGSTRRRLRRHHRVKTIKKSHKKRPTARRRRRHRRSSKARSTRRR